MKKYISLLLIICMLVSLCACGASTGAVVEPTATVAPTQKPTPKPTPRPVDGLKDDGKIHVYLIGDCEKVATPESSWIDSISYYPESGHMIISTNGNEYVSANVSESIWNDFKSAESKGKFYNKTFKGAAEYWINDYDGTNGDLIVMENLPA